MTDLEKTLKRIENKYKAYEEELNQIEESEDGMLDTSVLVSIADSVPFLVRTIREQEEKMKSFQ